MELNLDKDKDWNNRGIVLDDLKRYEKALQSYDQAVKLNPNDDQAWYNRGVCWTI
jgi:superkiller protein 3